MDNVKKYIIENGGQVKELPSGQIFTTWNGEDVSNKKYKVIVRFGGVGLIGYYFSTICKKLEEKGVLDMVSLGYSHCPRCNGTGVTHYTRDNGRCFKCNGGGYIK